MSGGVAQPLFQKWSAPLSGAFPLRDLLFSRQKVYQKRVWESVKNCARNVFAYAAPLCRVRTSGWVVVLRVFFLCGRGFESTEGHFSTLNFWFLLENTYVTTKVGQKEEAFSKWWSRSSVALKSLHNDGEAFLPKKRSWNWLRASKAEGARVFSYPVFFGFRSWKGILKNAFFKNVSVRACVLPGAYSSRIGRFRLTKMEGF